jgi:hypothetical protein
VYKEGKKKLKGGNNNSELKKKKGHWETHVRVFAMARGGRGERPLREVTSEKEKLKATKTTKHNQIALFRAKPNISANTHNTHTQRERERGEVMDHAFFAILAADSVAVRECRGEKTEKKLPHANKLPRDQKKKTIWLTARHMRSRVMLQKNSKIKIKNVNKHWQLSQDSIEWRKRKERSER